MGKPQIPPTTKGPKHAVPCPTCGHPNDFREIDDHRAENGDLVTCDKCNHVMQIVAQQTVTIVAVRRRPDIPPQQRERVGQATTISPGQAKKLLR